MYGNELELDERDELIAALRKELKMTRLCLQSHGEIVEMNAALRYENNLLIELLNEKEQRLLVAGII